MPAKSRERVEHDKFPAVIKYILSLDFIVIISIVILLLIIWSNCNLTNCNNNSILTFLIISFACIMAGSVIGFLFAIPRLSNQNSKEQDDGSRHSYYSDNTNLEEISDWLTKIIVGVSLVEFKSILGKLSDASHTLSTAFSGGLNSGADYYAFSFGCILFFSFSGFVMGYVWTRLIFPKMLCDSKNYMLDHYGTKIENAITQKNVTESKFAFSESELKSIDASEDVLALQKKVHAVLGTKSITVPDDLQKNRWGGKLKDNGIRIHAAVTANNALDGFYNVVVTIENVDGKPLQKPVAIFVHDSYGFPHDVIYLTPNQHGKAEVELTAFEAFTIGALAADGTELEIDLNDQPNYPNGFYWSKAAAAKK
jgi:hypothetical protein